MLADVGRLDHNVVQPSAGGDFQRGRSVVVYLIECHEVGDETFDPVPVKVGMRQGIFEV